MPHNGTRSTNDIVNYALTLACQLGYYEPTIYAHGIEIEPQNDLIIAGTSGTTEDLTASTQFKTGTDLLAIVPIPELLRRSELTSTPITEPAPTDTPITETPTTVNTSSV